MNNLATKFLKSEAIHKIKRINSSFLKLDTSLQNQKKKKNSDNNLSVGILIQSLLDQLLNEYVRDGASHYFYDSIRAFYKTANEYYVKWLSLHDPMYVNRKFINV